MNRFIMTSTHLMHSAKAIYQKIEAEVPAVEAVGSNEPEQEPALGLLETQALDSAQAI